MSFLGTNALVNTPVAHANRRGAYYENGKRHHVRRILIEAAWCYRFYPAKVSPEIQKRQETPAACSIRNIAWKCATQRFTQALSTRCNTTRQSAHNVTVVAIGQRAVWVYVGHCATK